MEQCKMIELKDLIVKAKNATISKKISWYKHTERENDFFSKLPDGLLLNVWTWDDPEDGDSGISFSITNDEYGPSIDRVASSEGSIYYNDMRNLFETAKKSALNIDKIIISIDEFLSL